MRSGRSASLSDSASGNGKPRRSVRTLLGRTALPVLALLLTSCSAAAPTPAPTLPPIIAGPSLAEWSSLEWLPGPAMPQGAGGGYFQLGVWPGGIVATSQGLTGDDGAWTSRDGLAWTKLPSDPSNKGVTVAGFAQTPTGLLAVGTTDPPCQSTTACPAPTSLLWTSTDGSHWQRQSDLPFGQEWFSQAFGDGRLVIVPTSGSQVHLWTSADGISWSSASIPAEEVTGISRVGSRYVVTGYVGNTALSPSRPQIVLVSTKVTGVVAAWTSTDGLAWTQVDGYQGPDEILAGASGYWGVTSSGPCSDQGKWWHSSDGSHWDLDPGNGPYGSLNAEGLEGLCGSPPRVLAEGGRMAALRSVPGGTYTIWISDGDENWRSLPTTGPQPPHIRTVTLVPGGVIANTDDGIRFGKGV